jgi:20S proteasome alpha/beta subunit
MTTIAYKNGVIAYDSRVTSGSTIVDDDFDKKVSRDGVSFFGTGSTPDIDGLIELYLGRENSAKDISASLIASKDGEITLVGWNQTDGIWKCKLDTKKPYAIGSGSDHAWTAMDCGLSSEQAVEMAKKRDSGSGGAVRTFSISP